MGEVLVGSAIFFPPPLDSAAALVYPARKQALLVCHGAQIAQLVEQRIENPRVAGSIPALGTT